MLWEQAVQKLPLQLSQRSSGDSHSALFSSTQRLRSPQALFNFKPSPLPFAVPPGVRGACAQGQTAPHEDIGALRGIFKAKIPLFFFFLVPNLVKHTRAHVCLSKRFGHLCTLGPSLWNPRMGFHCFSLSHQSSGSDGVTGNISSPSQCTQHKLTAQEPAAPTPLNNKQDSQGYNPPKLASHVGQHPAGVCTEHSHLSREMSGRLLPG